MGHYFLDTQYMNDVYCVESVATREDAEAGGEEQTVAGRVAAVAGTVEDQPLEMQSYFYSRDA